MRALRGIQPLHHSTLNYKSYNFMGVPNIPEPLESSMKSIAGDTSKKSRPAWMRGQRECSG